MNFKILLVAVFSSLSVFAQNQKTIKGIVTENNTEKTPLAFATVIIKGTEIGANTDENGLYELIVPEGTHQIEASYLGYLTKELTLNTAIEKELNFSLDAEATELDQVVIKVSTNKAKESVLLGQQRKSLEIKQQIGAQELSRKGVSDVAGAVVKTSGVNKQESTGGIFVRGLGDRYNSTTMNGLPIVSNNPDTKNIDLNLFSTDIVEFISIDKTYLARNGGDFGGANVDIVSKNHKGKGFLNLNLGVSGNVNALWQKEFKLQSGRNALGFSGYHHTDDLKKYDFKTPFSANSKRVPFGSSINVNGGKSFEIGEEGKLNLFATAGFNNDYTYKKGFTKVLNTQGFEQLDLNHANTTYNTNTTGMFNANYQINPDHKIAYNFLFINSSSLANDFYNGYKRDLLEDSEKKGFISRNTYTQNQLMIHQLLGEHNFNETTTLKWGASYNNIDGKMPDRTQTTMQYDESGNYYYPSNNSVGDNHRYFQKLIEKEIAVNAAVEHKFDKTSESQYKGKVIVGYNGRFKDRTFDAVQFNHKIENRKEIKSKEDLDQIFNASEFAKGTFLLTSFSGDNFFEIFYYQGKSSIHAPFAALEYQLTDKLYAVLGLRYDLIKQDVSWDAQLNRKGDNQLNKNAFLPSLNLKYEINGEHNLRFATSKTYTLPQFKERAEFIYEDVNQVIFGNPKLYASDNYNADLKWEYFPQNDEIYSVTLFGKYIKNPINLTNIASASNDLTYINTGDYGYAAGIELEIRKNILYFNDSQDNKLSAGMNLALMKTHQTFNVEKVKNETEKNINFTHNTASFTGASEILGNVDVTYHNSWGEKSIMATLAYNYNSDRIYSLGTSNIGNLVDKGFGTLDFILKGKFNEKFGISLAVKNLLNPSIDRTLENKDKDHVVQSYKLGQNVSLSVNYSF